MNGGEILANALVELITSESAHTSQSNQGGTALWASRHHPLGSCPLSDINQPSGQSASLGGGPLRPCALWSSLRVSSWIALACGRSSSNSSPAPSTVPAASVVLIARTVVVAPVAL